MQNILGLKKPVIGLSPMDGVTDAPFRIITKKYGGPDIMFTEFTHVMGICLGGQNVLNDLYYEEIERPIVAQIYGTEPEYFYHAAKVVCAMGFDAVDINMGCPAKSVQASGAGAGLIRTPDLAREIVFQTKKGINDWVADGKITGLKSKSKRKLMEMIESFNARPAVFASVAKQSQPAASDSPKGLLNLKGPKRYVIPVSIKTRIGYDSPVTESWIKNLTLTKPDWLSVHGRTLKQMYGGSANWDELKIAVEVAGDTPVLTNGDIKTKSDIKKILEHTQSFGALIGRGAFGNPWIFDKGINLKTSALSSKQFTSDYLRNENGILRLRQIAGKQAQDEIEMRNISSNFLSSTFDVLPTIDQRLSTMLEHAEHFARIKPDAKSFVQMRKHFAWYCKDFDGASKLRVSLMQVSSVEELKRVIEKFERLQ